MTLTADQGKESFIPFQAETWVTMFRFFGVVLT